MLSYNEIKPKKYIVFDGVPFEVLSSHVFRKQQRKPVNQTKLRNLRTGKTVEHSFHQADEVEEAELEIKKTTYLFKKPSRGGGQEFWFCEEGNQHTRFFLDESAIGTKSLFLKENTVVELFTFDKKTIGIKLPIKETLRVVEAPPAVKGNTAQGGTKQIILETGTVINAPLFINEGDSVVVNTETGEYVSRA